MVLNSVLEYVLHQIVNIALCFTEKLVYILIESILVFHLEREIDLV